MPNNVTIPTDTHVDGDPQHTTYHNQITDALRAAMGINLLDSRFAADPTGSLDSTSALISAVTALPSTGGVIKIPGLIPGTSTPATYRMDAGQINNLKPGVKILADGYGCATITCNGSGQTGAPYLFNMDPVGFGSSSHLEDVVISGLTISCTNADMFWGANLVRSRIEYNFLKQNSNAFSIFNIAQATGQAGANNGTTYLAECTFRNTEQIAGSARTTEAWHLDFSGSGLRCNDNRWEKGSGKIWPSLSGDTAQYWMKIIGDAAGSTGSKRNTWDGLIFELANGVGGLLHLLQCDVVNIYNISSEDLGSGGGAQPVGQPLLLFNTIGGGAEGCRRVTIRDYSRRSGGNISNSLPDFKFDANCDQVLIEAPRQTSGGTQLTIDLQSATNVTLRTPPTSYTLLNPGTGYHAPPAAALTTKPSNPASTTSTSLVMMGVAAAFTPAGTGQVQVTVTGTCNTATASVALTVGARYGTTAAPANGAAVTGTRFGAAADFTVRPAGTSGGIPFTFTEILALTPGTAYWFDIALDTSAGADAASVANLAFSFVEQP